MKVTTKMFFDRFMSGIQKNLEAVINDNEQISTGKRINRPSDDPTALSRVVNYKTQITSIGEYKRAMDSAKGPLESFDAAFGNLSEIMTRASELAISGASSITDANSRIMIAKEVNTLLERAVGIANTKAGDRYIFSGYRSDIAPIATSSGEFVSDSNTLDIDISVGIKIGLNVSAGDLFSFKRTNVTDSSNAVLPPYNWNYNGANTVPDADPVSALYTSTGGFVNSSDVFTTNGGTLNIKVGDITTASSGAFVINGTDNIITTNLGSFTVPSGIYTGASLATALSGLGAGINAAYDTTAHKFTITSTGAVTVDWTTANNIRKMLGFNSAVQTIGAGIISNNVVGDVNLAANSTLNDVRNAINTAGAEVKAEVINFGTNASPDYRMVVASNTVGNSDKIKMNVSTTDVTGTGLNRLSYDPGSALNMTLGTNITNYNYFSDPSTSNDSIVIGSTNNSIAIKEGALTGTAAIAQGTYTPNQLAAAIQTALQNATASANAYTVAYNTTTRKFAITSNAGNPDSLDMYWSNTATTAGQLLGYNAVDTTGIAAGSSDVSDNPVLANYYSFNNNYLNENNILRALSYLKTSLEANDTGRISKAIGYINKVSEKVYQTAADIGSRLNKIEAEGKYQDDREFNINSYLSNDQDTDLGKVVSDMAQRQNALQGLRTVSTDFLKTTLFDFLK